jgi:hypothetical protein
LGFFKTISPATLMRCSAAPALLATLAAARNFPGGGDVDDKGVLLELEVEDTSFLEGEEGSE